MPLDQARQGNADAVDALLARHREPVRRMIDLRLDPAIVQRLDASDVVQDVYIRRCELVDGKPFNVEFDRVEHVKDPGA